MTKFVYMFKEGNATMRNLLGGKGANLCEMMNIGLPVPHGFTISTEACTAYYKDGREISPEINDQIFAALKKMEQETGKVFGDKHNPLLVSVRSGARASMPGMMDTILNLGLNDEVVEGLIELSGNPRFAYDSYRRFITMFADVVMGIDKNNFEAILDDLKKQKGVELDTDLDADDMKEMAKRSLARYAELKGEAFPQEPREQLIEAVKAVFRSWMNDRAIYYRHMNNIPSDWGTAVNVQEMVYGNMGEDSGTGVAFSRNPATGEPGIYGEYLMNAQGEDVVAGIRTPFHIDHMKEQLPEVYKQFVDVINTLEKHYGDMQDIEFTIEKGKLFMLQCRNGKRTAQAALRVAVDMVNEGLVDKKKALLQIDPNTLDALLHPMFDQKALKAAKKIAKGLPASPGAAAGQIVFTAEDAKAAKEAGKKVILVRLETSPEDIVGMNVSEGILTVRGGMTSHAAVVARGMGKCCVSGCAEASVNEKAKTCTIGGKVYHEFDEMSLDGSTGQVYEGLVPTVPAEISGNFETIMNWSDEIRQMSVRTNADTPKDAKKARELGAGGIGLTRTEHMFFEQDRIFQFRRMILAKTEEERRAALAKIEPIQQGDFEGIFQAMDGFPVTIRLLDPPLHEFLPHTEPEMKELADSMGIKLADVQQVVKDLHELNPMLGLRGCRLSIVYPEIAEMQTAAIIKAALKVQKDGVKVFPEIMVPLISCAKELAFVRNVICKVADELIAKSGQSLKYHVGTMIEIPRAALTAKEVVQQADFFSFGTNDLTQMGYGLSRDDAGKILETYYEKGIFENDPTAILDQVGIGRLMEICAKESREVKPEVHLGICGEHGGQPDSIAFCHSLNFDYVSCSPFRVPIARLAAAQSEIRNPREYRSTDLKQYFDKK